MLEWDSRTEAAFRTGSASAFRRAVICAGALLVGACSFSSAAVTGDEMNERASKLTKLSAVMQSYIRYGNPTPGSSEQRLLAEGTREQPELLNEFSGFKLKVLTQDRHVVVLMCTKSGDRALLEDAGCTGKLEHHHWEKADTPCNFTISIPQVCGTR